MKTKNKLKKIIAELWGWFFGWILVSIPSMITMFYIWLKNVTPEKPNILGIEAGEILVYAISFLAPILAEPWSKKRGNVTGFLSCIALIAFIASIILFFTLKIDDFREKELFPFVCCCYVLAFSFSCVLCLISALAPDNEEIKDINNQHQQNLEEVFNRNLKEYK